MGRFRRWLILIGIVIFSHGVAEPALARVIITEVYPAPSSGQSEWVELTNLGAEVNLDGWWLTDYLTTPSLIHTFSQTLLQTGESLVIQLSSAKLNNTGDRVLLYNPDGELIDEVQFGNSSAASSWHRRVEYSPELIALTPQPGTWQPILTSPSPSPTTSPAPSPTPQSSSTLISDVVLSEIMSCPVGGQAEWVELTSLQATESILSGWSVSDRSGNQRQPSVQSFPNHYWVLSWPTGLLNNTGDALYIWSEDNHLVASAELASCQNGQSFIASSEGWVAAQPSQGTPNPSITAVLSDPTTSGSTSKLVASTELDTTTSSTTGQPSTSPLLPNLILPDPILSSHTSLSSTPEPGGKSINSHQTLPDQSPPFWPSFSAIMGSSCLLAIHGRVTYESFKTILANLA